MTGRTMLTFYIVTVFFISTIQSDSDFTKTKIYKCCDFGQYVGVAREEDGSINKKVCMNGTYNIDDMTVYDNDRGAAIKEKKLSSTFEVIPGKFNYDKKFRKIVVNALLFQQFNLYVTEDAVGAAAVLCSASGMFAGAHVDGFHAIMRKRVASLVGCMRCSSNSLLVAVAQDLQSSIMGHWMMMLKPVSLLNANLYLEMPNAYVRWTKLENTQFCVDYYMNANKRVSRQFWLIFPKNPLENRSEKYMTAAMFVSSFFLLLVLIVYSVLKELRNLCGQILIAYVASLLTAIFLLAIIRVEQRGIYVCYGLTLVIYFGLLASFCWMNVMSYDIWWTFRGYAKARPIHRRGEPFKYLMYSLYAWGVPLAMTIMLVTLDQTDLRHKPWIVKPNLQKTGRFIEGGEKLYYLYCPMLILICTNWMFFMMTAFNIWRLSRGTSVLDSAAAGTPAAHRSNRQRFLVYLKLTIVMGLNWLLEVVSFVFPNESLWSISDYYNILIGVSIFLIFVCKRKILRKLAKVYLQCKNRDMWHPGSSSRNNTTSEGSSSTSASTETETLKVCANPKGPGYVISNNF